MPDDSSGVALEDQPDPPAWVVDVLVGGQRTLHARMQWRLMLDSVPLTPAVRVVADRLWVHTLGREDAYGDVFSCDPSIRGLASRCWLSPQTVRTALDELERVGVVTVDRVPRRRSTYHLAWPRVQPTKPGRCRVEGCRRKAGTDGWCSSHPNGVCKQLVQPVPTVSTETVQTVGAPVQTVGTELVLRESADCAPGYASPDNTLTDFERRFVRDLVRSGEYTEKAALHHVLTARKQRAS